MYHEKRAKGRVLGLKEAIFHFPAINGELWERANSLFPVQLTRSWLHRVTQFDGPLGKQALPNALELVHHPDDNDDPVGECMDLILADKRVKMSMAYVAQACRNATKSTPTCMRRVFNSDGASMWMSIIAKDYCSPKVKE